MRETIQPTPEASIRQLDSITLLQLLGGSIVEQSGLRDQQRNYIRIAEFTTCYPFVVEYPESNEREYIVVSSLLRGMEINGLFHFAAPSKGYGYDTDDIRSDWTDLFSNPIHKHRLEAHRRIAGWTQFEAHREQVLTAIEEDLPGFGLGEHYPKSADMLRAIIHLNQNAKGEITWNFDPLDESVMVKLKTYPAGAIDRNATLSILGPLLVAAYNPQITKEWADMGGRRGYTERTPRGSDKATQHMGAT